MSEMYRKKPVVVEARLVRPGTIPEIVSWCNAAGQGLRWIDIQTLEGTMRANVGDYIIKGVKGEFYPCRADIFDATYERVDDTP